ncbi:MAG TPA: HAD family hydrolase [Bradyrhizobium sp.]|nr:HAD family hydrolase [Bradyrhizobium sp.]
MSAPIQTLLFDFGGTLDSKGIAWKERFHALYRAEGLNIPASDFQSIFFAADDPLVGGLAPETDLAGTVRALTVNLETEFARRGAGADGRCQRVASRFLADTASTIERNRPVLEALSERYRLGVVSNFYGNLEAVCHGAGLGSIFPVLVDSHCVGAEKPDPAIFHVALDALRATARTTVFVGDSLRRDREGARRTGMRFIWLQAEDSDPEAQAAAPPVEHAVTDLRDLMTVLA